MRLLILNGIHYRWDVVDGGKGLEIENKYISSPYCRIVFKDKNYIKEPEKKVIEVLNALFGNTLEDKITKELEIETFKHDQLKQKYNHQCKICGKVCKSKAGLAAHMRKHKKENKDGNKKK